MIDATGGMRPEGAGDPDRVRSLEEEGEIPGDEALRGELQSLPLEAEPPRDLWPGIHARLGPRGSGADHLPVAAHPTPDPGAIPARAHGSGGGAGTGALDVYRARRPGRVSLSWGQAAAAGLVLMLASGSMVWMGVRGGIPAAPAPAALPVEAGPGGLGAENARFVTAEEAFDEYDVAVSDLKRIVTEASDQLEPETVQVLEENLATVEAALAESRQALLADPSGEMMSRLLSGTMRRRLGVLRQAVAMAVAQS
jgi:hypothetical protein